ncbi:MAG TPA: pur operon repressor, partial [Candidatus Limnocylindria bacterium]|nr:pur operon repressor [Candidatus Limnocylindria bacterium]
MILREVDTMDKTKRGTRLAALTAALAQTPNRVIPFGVFCERFGAAKSSVSEDVAMIRDAL